MPAKKPRPTINDSEVALPLKCHENSVDRRRRRLQVHDDLCISLFTKTLAIEVGAELDGPTEVLHLHRGVAEKCSPFLANIMKNGWKEDGGHSSPVSLPHVKPETFKIYQAWVYNRLICCYEEDEGHVKGHRDSAEIVRLREAFALADYLQDADFADAIIDTRLLCARDDDYVDLSFAPDIYTYTQHRPGQIGRHRDLAIRYVLWEVKRKHNGKQKHDKSTIEALMDGMNDTPNSKELLMDFSKFFTMMVERVDWDVDFWEYDREPCKFHRHTELGEICYKSASRY